MSAFFIYDCRGNFTSPIFVAYDRTHLELFMRALSQKERDNAYISVHRLHALLPSEKVGSNYGLTEQQCRTR